MRALSRRNAVRIFLLSAALPLSISSSFGSSERVALAIKGYDPVAYFTTGTPTQGSPVFTYEWNGLRYQFSSAKHRDLFVAEPARYAPQFGNFCAMALSKGELVEADPNNWLISDGKLYVYGKPAPAGPALFQKDLAGNIAKANQNRSLIPNH